MKGELASQVVSNFFGNYFEEKAATIKNLQQVLQHTQEKFDEYIHKNEVYRSMGTTITFLQFNKNGVIIAHAGDSRVYHIRQNKVLFCTKDHSLVNELINKGKLEEAKYAKTNVITRAVQGSSVKKVELDIHQSADIQLSLIHI